MKPKWRKAEEFWRDFLKAKGRLLPGSGNIPGMKGDSRYLEPISLRVEGMALLESKQTDAQSLSVEQVWLKKITTEASSLGRIPLLGLQIGTERWLAIPTWALEIGEQSNVQSERTIGNDDQRNEP